MVAIYTQGAKIFETFLSAEKSSLDFNSNWIKPDIQWKRNYCPKYVYTISHCDSGHAYSVRKYLIKMVACITKALSFLGVHIDVNMDNFDFKKIKVICHTFDGMSPPAGFCHLELSLPTVRALNG